MASADTPNGDRQAEATRRERPRKRRGRTHAHLRRELLDVGDVLGELGHLGLRDGILALAVELAGDAMKLACESPGPARQPTGPLPSAAPADIDACVIEEAAK